MPAIITLLGGTVGGYITFAGAHRLIDAGITGEKNLKEINKSSVMGIGIATIVRIFLFLAVLGVVVKGVALDPANPAADAFRKGAGVYSEHSENGERCGRRGLHLFLIFMNQGEKHAEYQNFNSRGFFYFD